MPRREFYAKMDAANIDLKAFTEAFYFKLCVGHLKDVLDTLVYVHHETDCWLEITTLLIPEHNDSEQEITELSRWVAKELGPDVPLHFSAFHPDYKLLDAPPTDPQILTRARRIALDAGLHYVYTGNVHDREGDTTYCPNCSKPVIARDWYQILAYHLTPAGCCQHCGSAIAGRFGEYCQPFGAKRIPVTMTKS